PGLPRPEKKANFLPLWPICGPLSIGTTSIGALSPNCGILQKAISFNQKSIVMKKHQSRRTFVGALALGATATGMATVAHPLRSWYLNRPVALDESPENRNAMDWFDKIKGNHRAVFDGSMPHGGFPIIWNWAYYLSHNETGSPDSDITGLTVLRHDAIPFALDSSLWAKYQLGEHFNITDNATGQASLRNPYYQPKEGDMPMPGIGGIKSLLDRGAMFCVCNLALKVYSEMAAH